MMFKNLALRLGRSVRDFRRSDRAVAAIEFAIVAPPFILLLGATIETGLMMFAEYVIQQSVNDSARLVRTGQAQTNPLDAGQFKAAICKTASIIINCTGGVTVYVRSDKNFQTMQSSLPPLVNIGPSVGGGPSVPACYNPGQPSQPAAVVATYDWYFNAWGMSAFSNLNGGAARRLIGFAVFQNEPFNPVPTNPC